jgi:hypothetical protein
MSSVFQRYSKPYANGTWSLYSRTIRNIERTEALAEKALEDQPHGQQLSIP